MKLLKRTFLALATVVLLIFSGFTTIASAGVQDQPRLSVCQETPVAAHRGSVGPKTDENTLEAFRLAVRQRADIIETDLRFSRSGTGWFMHNPDVRETTNGHGLLRSMSDKQLSRLRTKHGSSVPRDTELITFLVNNPEVGAQVELKDYSSKPKWLKAFGQKVLDAGLQDRIAWSSGSRQLLLRMAKFTPGMRLEWIGFNEDLPPLSKFGKKIDQSNVLYRAAFRHYGGYATYMGAAKAKGIDVSIRSTASGEGDNPVVWARAIKAGVTQFVTNRLPLYRRWCDSR